MNPGEIEYFKQHDIQIISSIGEGGYGSVYYVYSSTYKTYFALKKIPQKNFKQAEIDCLMTLDDPNIVRLYKYYKYEDNFYLLMEYCPSDLNKLLANKQKMSNPAVVQKIISDVIKAVKACHLIQIAHGDIKSSNFLIDSYGRIKICDFGMSTMYTQSNCSTSLFKGTLHFMAPEVFSIGHYDPIRADIWSLGVTLYVIATGYYPFNGLDQHALKDNITKGLYNQDALHDPLLKDLIAGCLETDLTYRSTISELSTHPYFSKTFVNRGERIPLKKGEIVRPNASSSLRISKHRSTPLFSGLSASRVHLIQVESHQ